MAGLIPQRIGRGTFAAMDCLSSERAGLAVAPHVGIRSKMSQQRLGFCMQMVCGGLLSAAPCGVAR